MKPPLTVNGITLRYLCLRDWNELTHDWLAARQHEQEASLRRASADPSSALKAAQDYAARRSTYGLLLEMCKTYDGAQAILARAAKRGGVTEDALDAALEGMDPDAVAILAMRACGWDLKHDAEPNQGNA